MKTNRRVTGTAGLLTSALQADDRSTSHFSHFTPEEQASGAH
jgi:hypothetical protein